MKDLSPETEQEARDMAKQLAKWAKDSGQPCAFEVVKTKPNKSGLVFNVQPSGMHSLFKSHKLIHVEPIPA